MSGKMNYERAARQERLRFYESPRVQSATQPQLDYIVGLVHQKGQPKPRLPKTKKGASDLIERLLALPDVNERKQVRLAPAPPVYRDQSKQDLGAELRERFPVLTPMTVNSFIQLFSQVDEIGVFFFLSELMTEEETPAEIETLVPFIMARFVEWIAPVKDDDKLE